MSQHSNLPYHTIADKQRQERIRRVVDTANACLLHSSAGPSIPPFPAAREAMPWCIVCHAWRIRGSVLKPQQPTLGRIRPERRPREAWQPSHVPTRRRAGHCDEPWTLPCLAMAIQGSRSHLHGTKCAPKQGVGRLVCPGAWNAPLLAGSLWTWES